MKKFLLAVFLISGVLSVSAQNNFSTAADTVSFSGLYTKSEINGRIYIYNNSGAVLPIRVIRTIESIPSQWETSFCNKSTCYPEEVDSVEFNLAATGSNYLLVHYYLNQTVGIGTVKLRIYEVDNPENEKTLTFIGESKATTSINESAFSTISIFPVPAKDELNIRNENLRKINYTVHDITGKELLNGSLNGTEKINISSLNNGIYLLRMNIDGESQVKRFVKK